MEEKRGRDSRDRNQVLDALGLSFAIPEEEEGPPVHHITEVWSY